jgi:hypothetical protein
VVRVTIPIAHLRAAGLGEQVEALSAAVAAYLDDDETLDRVDSNVAVISDPFGGRDALCEYAAELLDDQARHVTLSSVVTDEGDLPEIPTDQALLLSDCHYLYRRGIGGFEMLETFLERLAMTNTLVVTTWNRYSWRYLAAVHRIDEVFPLEITLPPLSADQIAAVIDAHIEGESPEFVDTGEAGRIKTVDVYRHDVGLWGDRSISVPLVRPNLAWLVSWSFVGDDDSVEAVVYEKLRRLSHGNPGIATTLWDRSVRDDGGRSTVAPGYIEDPVGDSTVLSDDAAFLLWLVVAMEGVERSELAEMLGEDAIGTAIQTLANRGIVTVDDTQVRLEPTGLHPAVEELQRRRLVW